MESKGRKIHAQAEVAREKGEFVEALKFTDEAMVVYQEEGDRLGFSEVQASRFLTLRHLYEKTDWRGYLILAKQNAEASVELAEASGDLKTLALPYFNLAKAREELEQYHEAIESYKKAIENMEKNPAEQHNRAGVIADMKEHLAVCEYKTGDKEAIGRAEEAIAELAGINEEKYNKDVWMSGGYIRIAEVLKKDDPKKAREHLEKAREIIDANPELVLRKKQWEKLAASFE